MTIAQLQAIQLYNDFNSHAHVERDLLLLYKKMHLQISTHTLTWSVTIGGEYVITVDGISTHTLTWSVTRSGIALFSWSTNFNSHAHVERDSPIYDFWHL